MDSRSDSPDIDGWSQVGDVTPSSSGEEPSDSSSSLSERTQNDMEGGETMPMSKQKAKSVHLPLGDHGRMINLPASSEEAFEAKGRTRLLGYITLGFVLFLWMATCLASTLGFKQRANMSPVTESSLLDACTAQLQGSPKSVVQACFELKEELKVVAAQEPHPSVTSFSVNVTEHLLAEADESIQGGHDLTATQLYRLAHFAAETFARHCPSELRGRAALRALSLWNKSMRVLDSFAVEIAEKHASEKAKRLKDDLEFYMLHIWPSLSVNTAFAVSSFTIAAAQATEFTSAATQLARDVTVEMQSLLRGVAEQLGRMDLEALRVANDKAHSFAQLLEGLLTGFLQEVRRLTQGAELQAADAELTKAKGVLEQAAVIASYSQHMSACVQEFDSEGSKEPYVAACRELREGVELVAAHPQSLLSQSLMPLYASFTDHLLKEVAMKLGANEDVAAMAVLELSQMVVTKLSEYLPTLLPVRVSQLQDSIWNKSMALVHTSMQDMAHGQMSEKARDNIDKLRMRALYVWPILLETSSARAKDLHSVTSLAAQSIKSAVQQMVHRIEQACQNMEVGLLDAEIASARRHAYHVEGFAGIMSHLGQAGRSDLREVGAAVQEVFGTDSQLNNIAKAFAWLGAQPRPCTSVELDELLRQANEQASNLGRISCSCDLPLCSHLKYTRQQFYKSAAYLKASPDARQYTLRSDALVSYPVHSCLDMHISRAEEDMQKHVFDNATHLLLTLPRWQHVRLPLEVEKRQQALRNAIDLYATRQAADVMWHLDNSQHKSLQVCIDGLMSLRDVPGLSLASPSIALEAMNGKIAQRIDELAAAGRHHILSADQLAVAQLAHSLIRLGSIWGELLHFKPMAEQRIEEMLELCMLQGGQRIPHLRDYLMKMTTAEGISETDEAVDGTKSRAAVAMRLVLEFGQLKKNLDAEQTWLSSMWKLCSMMAHKVFWTVPCTIWAAVVAGVKALWTGTVWFFSTMRMMMAFSGRAFWNGSVSALGAMCMGLAWTCRAIWTVGEYIWTATLAGSVCLKDSMNGSTVVSIFAVFILDALRTWINKPRS